MVSFREGRSPSEPGPLSTGPPPFLSVSPPPQDLGFLERTARRTHLSPGPGPSAGGAEGSRGHILGRTGLSLRPCPVGGVLLLQGRKHMRGGAGWQCLPA